MHLRKIGWLLLMAAIVLVAVLPVPEFWITQLNYIGISSLAVLGLVLLTGIGGLTSFGQAAFVGIGAYTTAYLTVNAGLSPWLTLFVGMGLTAVCAFALGWITLRMSGHYLPLATLAWGLSLYYTMGNLEALGKYDGILGISGLSLFGWQLGQGRLFFLLTWALVLLAALGQSFAVQCAHRHRIPVHGGTGRCRPCMGRDHWRPGDQAAGRSVAGAVTGADRHQRQLRNHSVRRLAGADP